MELKYKDRLFIAIMIIYLISTNDDFNAILLLSACFISLEYPLKKRKLYFWIIVVYILTLFIIGVVAGIIVPDSVNLISNVAHNNILLIMKIAVILTLYYRDNDDFVFKEKIKKILNKKESDTDTM